MKKGLLIGAFALSSMAALAQDVVASKIVGLKTGGEWVVNIELQNSTKFVAFSMDVDLPSGCTVVDAKSGNNRITDRLKNGKVVSIANESNVKTSYSANYKVEYNLVGNVLHIVGYSLGNEPIVGNSGDVLFQTTLSTATNTLATAFDGKKIRNVKFVKQADLTAAGLADATAQWKQRGDVNLQNGVTVDDAQVALNMSAGITPKTVYGDVNNDGRVTVDDAQVALNIAAGL